MLQTFSAKPWEMIERAPITSLLACGVATLALLLLIRIIYLLNFHPLANYPGPWNYAVSDIFYSRMVVSGYSHSTLRELHDKYGEVVRIAPNDLSFTGAAAWRDIYGHRTGGTLYLKDPKFYITDDEYRANNVFTTKDPATHAKARKMLSYAFSAKALLEQESTITKYVDMLMVALQEECTKGKPLNMVDFFNWTTFDVIGDLGFGEPFGCLERRQTDPWVSMILSMVSFIGWDVAIHRFPWASNLAQYIIPKKIREDRDNHILASKAKILKRLELKTDRKDFVSYIMKEKEAQGLTDWQLAGHSHTLIIAGSETTATMLAGWLYWVLKTPRAYSKLKSEVRESFRTVEEITISRLVTLPYLNATIQEGMRMFPPVPTTMPRIAPKGGGYVDGHFVPEGTSLGIPQFAAYRNVHNFHNPDSFMPERWTATTSKDRKEALQPFSIGPRGCLGQNMAWMELRLITAKIIYLFDMEIADHGLDWDASSRCFVIWEKPVMPVYIKIREPDKEPKQGTV